MFDKLTAVEKRYDELLQLLGSAEVQSDPSEYRKHAKAASDIELLVERFREYKTVTHDLTQAEELAASGDADMRELAQEEVKALTTRRDALLADLKILLIPKDPNDEKNVVLEIRAGTGGVTLTLSTSSSGGTIVDGSGAPRFSGDIGVRDGKVAEVGRLTGEARQTVDADGLVVAPGIIDVHTHYDPQLTFEPLATSSVWHGVTTVVGGNCGFTLAPNRPQDRDFLVRMFAGVEGMSQSVLEAGLPWTWQSFPEFLATLEKRLGINTMVYVGHSALRRHVMGEAASASRRRSFIRRTSSSVAARSLAASPNT